MKKVIRLFILFLGTLVMYSQEPKNSNTTICWDVSLSMVDRDITKDLSVLEKVFQRNANQEVQVLLFNMIIDEKIFNIKNGDWKALKTYLTNAHYDGGTIYSQLESRIKNSNVYVFTDGNKTLSIDRLTLKGKSYLINSSAQRDARYLERTALLNKSRLMDFATMLPENVKKLQLQKKTIKKETQLSKVKGTVYVDNKPTSNIRVGVKGISDSFLTGRGGEFSIEAKVGDTLVFTSRNNKTIKAVPVEAMVQLNVFMKANIISLDEVIVVEKMLKEDLLSTGYGLQDKKTLGYSVSTIGEEDISEVQTNISETINTKVSGLRLGKSTGHLKGTGIERAEIRGRNTINMNPYALVVVNGVPMQRTNRSVDMATGAMTDNNGSSDLSGIDPGNIAKITVLKGLAATNAYGSEGGNGVILITTKSAESKGEKNEKRDLALIQNNIYTEDQMQTTTISNTNGIDYNSAATTIDAYNKYLLNRNGSKSTIKFYIHAFNYFKNKDQKIAKNIISSILEDPIRGVKHLKVVASALSEIQDYENVIRINEEIIAHSPSDVNAYYNIALANIGLGKYQEALKELIALRKGDKYVAVNATGFVKTIDRDIKNIIFKHKDVLDLSNVDPTYFNNVKYKVRMVFEWNKPGAEFELQFVNPQKRFFNWVHINNEMQSRITDEIKNNYRVEEYEFYGDVAGEWIMNAKFLGETIAVNDIPLIIKCTLYKNFGYAEQTKEDIVVQLVTAGEKKNLKALVVN